MTALIRVRFLVREVDDRCGLGDFELLSVSATRGVIPRSEVTTKEPRADELSNYKICRTGDIVVNRMSAYQGALGLARQEGIVSPDYIVFRPTSRVEPRWLQYVMRSAPFVSEMAARIRGIGSIGTGNVRTPRVSASEIGDIPIRHPSPEAQRAIADFLDLETARIDVLIDKKQQLASLLEERRTAAIDHAIHEAPGALRPIAALADYINGWPFKPEDHAGSGTPIIRISQLVDPGADVDHYDGDLPDRVTLRDGDLVFSWSGSLQVRRWHRGRAFLNQHLFRVLPRKGIDIEWLAFGLDAATRLFQAHMHGSAMTHITQPMMKLVRLPVPSEEQQRQVASTLEVTCARILRAQRCLEAQIGLLREHRQALITSAVTGELDVPGAAA